MTENELDEIIANDDCGGLFEGNDLFNLLVERSKINAESIEQARTSYSD
jgi:hypothetical protein